MAQQWFVPFKQGLDAPSHERNWTSLEEFLNALNLRDGPIDEWGTHIIGDGPPSGTDGQDGDVWFDLTNGKVYVKEPGGWTLALDALTQADYDILLGLIEGKVEWKNLWSQTQYDLNDMIIDGAWTMIANKTTSDRAAPQPIGQPAWLQPDVQPWVTLQHTGSIYSGVRFVIPDGELYVISAKRVWIPDVSPDASYQLLTVDNTTGATSIGTQINGDVLAAPGWLTVQIDPVMLFAGADYSVLLVSTNSAATTDYNHPWIRGGNVNQDNDPGLGAWTTNTQTDKIRISKTDADSTDRSAELLAAVPGTDIKPVDELDLAAFFDFDVVTATDMGTWVLYDVLLVDTGASGPPTVGERQQLYFEVPVAAPTDYVHVPDFFLSAPSVNGYLSLDTLSGGLTTEDAYSVDLEYQQYTASPDWDLVAMSGSSGGGGSGDGSGLPVGGTTDQALTKVDDTDYYAQWTGPYVLVADKFGGFLDNLTDVSATNPVEGQRLAWDNVLQLWVPKQSTSALGIVVFNYRISNATPTPNAGRLAGNIDDPPLVTTIYVNKIDDDGEDRTLFLENIVAGVWLNIHDDTDANNHRSFDVTGTAVLNGDVFEIPVTFFDEAGDPLTTNQQVNLFIRYVAPEPTDAETTYLRLDASNDPAIRHDVILDSEFSLIFDNTSYLSTPWTADLDLSTGMEYEADVAPTSWGSSGVFIANTGAAPLRGQVFSHAVTDSLRFTLSIVGLLTAASSEALGAVGDERHVVKVNYDTAVDTLIRFYIDNGLVSSVILSGTPIGNDQDAVRVGADENGVNEFDGVMFSATIRDGTDGVDVLRLDPIDAMEAHGVGDLAAGDTFISNGREWTVHGNGVSVGLTYSSLSPVATQNELFPGAHSDLSGVTPDDHHVKYTDLEAQIAMGSEDDANPLNHDRYSDDEARAAVGDPGAGVYLPLAGGTITGETTVDSVGFRYLLDNGGDGWFIHANGNIYPTYKAGGQIQMRSTDGTNYNAKLVVADTRIDAYVDLYANADLEVAGTVLANGNLVLQGAWVGTEAGFSSTGAGANLVVSTNDWRIRRSTSARKYKSQIRDVPELADIVLRPTHFWRDDDQRFFYGQIADDLATQDELLVTFDENGEVENYDVSAILAVLAAKVNRLEAQ